MITSKEYTTRFKVANTDYGYLTIPKGTPVTNQTALGIDKRYHFINCFKWVDADNKLLLHDLKYYGINVPIDFIEK